MQIKLNTGWLKIILGWLTVFIIRLIPWRPANVEPMLATAMPFAKHMGLISSFFFSALGIALFDLVTNKLGLWTLITATTYGAVTVFAYYFFKKREATITNFAFFGIIGTLVYDAITGLSIGPLFYNQSFMSALIGQIPFTMRHLAGTIGFSIVLSPLLHRYIVTSKILEIGVSKTKEA